MAASAAAEAVKDDTYACRTIRAATEDRRDLRDRLTAIGLDVYPSAGNFLLFRLPPNGPDSTRLRAALIQRHRIVVRDCRSFEGMEDGCFLRVAVRARTENERLVGALETLLREERR
jgi:threonine-phosphate decarboxylase